MKKQPLSRYPKALYLNMLDLRTMYLSCQVPHPLCVYHVLTFPTHLTIQPRDRFLLSELCTPYPPVGQTQTVPH